jgi:phospholipase/carboxylesterase
MNFHPNRKKAQEAHKEDPDHIGPARCFANFLILFAVEENPPPYPSNPYPHTPMTHLETFRHVFIPGTENKTLLLLHGTGGTEHDLIDLGKAMLPGAALLSPRGRVLENGMPRFFRRLAEGVFDEEDLIRRTHELADFITESITTHGLDASEIYAIGYSNGANIASSLMLLRPEILAGAALWRPMVPLLPEQLPDLSNKDVLIAAGYSDPIVPEQNVRQLVGLLKDAGAKITLRFENAGHGLTQQTFLNTKAWFETIA